MTAVHAPIPMKGTLLSQNHLPSGARASRRTRPRSLALLALVGTAVASLVAGCAAQPPAQNDGTVVVAVPSQATQLSWDAGWVNSPDYLDLQGLLNGTLIRKPYMESEQAGVLIQDVSKYEPYLAESYDVSEDQLTYTFHLKEGVISQAGNELTADDVIWSFERKFNAPASISPGLLIASGLSDPASQMQKIDDYTVSFTVAQPGYGFTLLGTLSDNAAQVYDSTFLSEHATPEDPYAVEWSEGQTGFGFGPYRVEQMTEGETIIVADENWVLGEPEIQRVVRRVVPDAGNRALAVRSGDVDMALALRPNDLVDLEAEGNVLVPSVPTGNRLVTTMVVNNAPFDDVRVRQALAYAINYERIIEDNSYGRATEEHGWLNPTLPGYSSDGLPQWTYDVEKSQQLLAEAGLSGGVPFTLTISNDDPQLADIAVSMQDSARDAGFEIEIERLPASQYREVWAAGTAQAFLSVDGYWNVSPAYALLLNYYEPQSGSRWKSPEFEQAVEQGMAAGEVTSDEAGAFWNQAESLMLNDAGVVYMAKQLPAVALTTRLENWAYRTDGTNDLASMTFADQE